MLKIKYLSLGFQFSMAADIQEGFEPRAPPLQLELPLEDVTASHDHEMRAPVAYKGEKRQNSPFNQDHLSGLDAVRCADPRHGAGTRGKSPGHDGDVSDLPSHRRTCGGGAGA